MARPGIFSPQICQFAPFGTASPAVSVVTTAYNDRRFLREAVEAVLAQSFTDFEFVIVDNGSDDPAG